jgi:hypothetical protein
MAMAELAVVSGSAARAYRALALIAVLRGLIEEAV